MVKFRIGARGGTARLEAAERTENIRLAMSLLQRRLPGGVETRAAGETAA